MQDADGREVEPAAPAVEAHDGRDAQQRHLPVHRDSHTEVEVAVVGGDQRFLSDNLSHVEHLPGCWRDTHEPDGDLSPRRSRLDEDAWIDAALRTLLESGPDAIKVERLAAELGTTKGSLYWHFERRADLLDRALQRWEERYTDRFIAHTEASADTPEARLRALLEAVTVPAPDLIGEARLHAAAIDPQVGPTVQRVHARRTAYVVDLLRQIGVEEPETRATLAYATVLGIEQLHAAGTAGTEDGRLAELLFTNLTQQVA